MWPFKKKPSPAPKKEERVVQYPTAGDMRSVAKDAASRLHKKQVEFWFNVAMDNIQRSATKGKTETLVTARDFEVDGHFITYRQEPSRDVLDEVADRLEIYFGYKCSIEEFSLEWPRVRNMDLPSCIDFKVSW